MAIYLNVITLSLEFFAVFLLSILILRQNHKSLTSVHLFFTFLIYSISIIFNILFIISSEDIEIYKFMFRMIVVFINISIILLCGSLILVVWGEAEYIKKILIPSIILLIFIILVFGCYGSGVYYDPGSGLHFIVMIPLYGWSALFISILGLTISILVSIYIILKIEKQLRKRLLFFSFSIVFLLLDVIILGLVNMRFISSDFIIYSHIFMIFSTFLFYIWFVSTKLKG